MTEPASPDAVSQKSNAKKTSLRNIELDHVDADITVSDRIALLEAGIRRTISYTIMGLFGAVNVITLVFMYALFRFDQYDIAAKIIQPADRVVNAQVLMTMLGATTVQLGAAMLIMARFIFRSPVDQTVGRAE